jgi:hypothetical protein
MNNRRTEKRISLYSMSSTSMVKKIENYGITTKKKKTIMMI